MSASTTILSRASRVSGGQLQAAVLRHLDQAGAVSMDGEARIALAAGSHGFLRADGDRFVFEAGTAWPRSS